MDTKEKLLVFAQLYISILVVRAFGKWYIGSNDVLFSNISKLFEPVSVFLLGRIRGYSVSFRPIASIKSQGLPCVPDTNKPGFLSL